MKTYKGNNWYVYDLNNYHKEMLKEIILTLVQEKQDKEYQVIKDEVEASKNNEEIVMINGHKVKCYVPDSLYEENK